MPETPNFEGVDSGGITTEEAAKALTEALTKVQDDPYFKLVILPMMEQRIKYDNSWRGKLFPYSPLDRIKREVLILKIASFFCIGLVAVLLIIDISLITMT